LVGYGSVGRQVARLLQPFGVKIMATKRDLMHPEDPDYSPDGMGDPNGDFFTRLYPVQAIKSMLKECDFVVITMPLTPQTKHLIGAGELAACKQDAFIINASRGEIIEEEALIAALTEKRIAGAALDVFAIEPLPPNHPLWDLPNVIITPHIAGNSPLYTHRAIQLFVENLQRYQNGSPLFNTFDPDQQY
jgi:phosphoglycerate dehydrogenase-like enzyme